MYLMDCVITSINVINRFFFRIPKEATSHLSPVKKRVKENTPPHQQHSTVTSSSHLSSDWLSHTTPNTQRHKSQRQPIVIGDDSPSPAVSVITISSDDEEEEGHFNKR